MLFVRIKYALKVALRRNDSVSPRLACTLYSFACRPALCGAPQSLSAMEELLTVSSVIPVSTHGWIVYVIGTVSGDPMAPVAANTILALCVAVLRLSGLSVTSTLVDVVSCAGTVPPESERVTHPVSSTAVHVSGRPPLFLMCRVKVSGCALRTSAEVSRRVGDTASSAAGGSIWKTMGTLTVLVLWLDVKTIVS